MLLKIQVYPAPADPSQPQSLQPEFTHFASLVNTAKNDDGKIWSLGRKQGDCLVSDKSISRQHVYISIYSSNKSLQDKEHPPALATTHKQLQACQDNDDPYQMCAVLRNTGKLGSYLVGVDDETKAAAAATKNGDDSDTADEQEVLQSQSQAAVADVSLSKISQHLQKGRHARLEHIGFNQDIVLALHHHDTTVTKPVILQCGKMGTTLVISRVPINLLVSGGAKKELGDLPLYAIGGQIIQEAFGNNEDGDNNNQSPTHLVTHQYGASHKQLIAWCKRIPIVGLSFVQALLQRSSPLQPLPEPKRYPPESDGNDFWQTPPNPNLWNSCTLLSIHPNGDELETLAVSAGAKCIPLYDGDGKAYTKDQVQHVILEQPNQCNYFGLVDNRRKLGKLLKALKVPCVMGKELARAVVQQRLLEDSNGNSIGTLLVADDDKEQQMKVVNIDNDGLAAKDDGDDDDDDAAAAAAAAEENIVKPAAEPVVAQLRDAEDDDDDKKAATPTANNRTEHFDVADGDDVEMEDADKAKETTTPAATASSSATEMKRRQPDEETSAPNVENERTKRKETSENDATTISEPRFEKKKRKNLQPLSSSSSLGWLSALPQGKKRREYVRSKDEIREATGVEEVLDGAVTEVVKDLMVVVEPAAAVTPTVIATGPNFKAFRKNPVPAEYSNAVRLTFVLPKESDFGLEEEQEAIEAQQRRADELFHDGGAKSSGRRRR